MEEQILSIIQKSIYYSKENVTAKEPLIQVAKEIASEMTEFIEWLTEDRNAMPINDLYEFWRDNVKKK